MATIQQPLSHTRPQAHAARLAETATRLLPHLAVGLYRAIQQQQPTEHLLRAIEKCGRYLDLAERSATRG